MEGGAEQQFFAPMLLMPVYYNYTSQSPPMPTTVVETIEPKLCEQSSDSSSSSCHDDLYAILCNIYENKRKWHFVEDGVCLRVNPLPLLDQCYVEGDNFLVPHDPRLT